MSFIIKTAAVTQKGANGEFNSDNLNLNGRVLSIENANNGFKGAGSMRAPFVVAFASSPYNGFAGAALTALCDRTDALKKDDNSFASVLDGYFADSKHALEQCNCEADGLAVSMLVGYESKLVAAKMGNACILRYTDGDLVNMGTEQAEQPYFCEEISVNHGDMYVLCPSSALSALTEGEIIVALNAADGNEKKAVQMLAGKFAKRNPEASDTFVVIRVEQQGAPAVVAPVVAEAAAPVHEEPVAAAQEESADYEEENVYEPETDEYDEEPQADPRKKLLLWVILCVALVLGMVIAGFAAYKISFARNHSDVSAGVVVAGSDAQYDVDIDLTTEAPTTEAVTEPVTEEATSEDATEAPTEAETTTEEDDYYYDDDYYEDDDDDYYEDNDDEATVPETVPRPTEAPTEAPTQAPTDAPTDAPDNNDDEPTQGRPIEAPTDNTFEEF